MALVSIVMPVFNTAPYVGAAVRSVLASSHRDLEVVVIDDGSTDGSTDVVAEIAAIDPRVRLCTGPHEGLRAAVARAHSLASGDLIGCVDSDDLLYRDAIASCVPFVSAGSELVYTWRRLIDDRGVDRGLHSKNRIPYDPLTHLVSNMVFHFRLYTRHLFDRCGGVSDLAAAIDWDLSLRMAEHTAVQCVPEILYSYRVRPGRVSGSALQRTAAETAVRRAIDRRGLEVDLVVDDGRWGLRRRSTSGHGLRLPPPPGHRGTSR